MSDYPTIEYIDSDLGELLDRFFEASRQDVEAMWQAIAIEDFRELLRLGHTARGTGSGYGFKGMGIIGRGIEEAANAQDTTRAQEQVKALARYLDTVKVEFNDFSGGGK